MQRVEVVLRLWLGAPTSDEVVVDNVAIAVAPETDRVEIFEVGVALQLGQCTRHLVGGHAGDAMLAQDAFDFGQCFRGLAHVLDVDL